MVKTGTGVGGGSGLTEGERKEGGDRAWPAGRGVTSRSRGTPKEVPSRTAGSGNMQEILGGHSGTTGRKQPRWDRSVGSRPDQMRPRQVVGGRGGRPEDSPTAKAWEDGHKSGNWEGDHGRVEFCLFH